MQTEQNKELAKRVKELRNKGMLNQEIAIELNEKKKTIANIASQLIHKGEITSQQGKGRRSSGKTH